MTLTDSIRTIFSEDGALSSLPGYEFRPQQREMAEAILSALEEKHHLIIEAPTGVGKSLAYLIPALLFAGREGRKAIVSTHTKNLQEQLLRKDIPIVRSLLDQPFTAVAFKGRGNYLCSTRLKNAVKQQKRLFEETEFDHLQRIQQWSLGTREGDIDDLPFVPLKNVWQQVCSEKGACSPGNCKHGCFFQKARNRARTADLVIMNHALFFTLFALGESDEFFIFRDDFVIFDEAHTLEQIAGPGVGKSLSRAQVIYAIRRLFNPKSKKGLLSRPKMKEHRKRCADAERMVDLFFDEIRQAAGSLSNSSTLRVKTRYLVADTVTDTLKDLRKVVETVAENIRNQAQKDELLSAGRLVGEAEVLIREFLELSDASATYWVELGSGRQPNVALRAAPTSVAESVGGRLFRDGATVVMTSGTLSVNRSLAYFQNRLGAATARTAMLDSPFDFRRQMRISLVRGIPPPDMEEYQEALPDQLLRALSRSRGRALVLFTNASLMKSIGAKVRHQLESEGTALLLQDGSVSRHQLLERFKADVRSVLFGLDSFWMGVDVPGEALEHVIITRLPFAVPDHPLIESRMELIAQRGGNSFFDYTLPEAVLKFRQGAGRLIRSTTDGGMITLLDSRILTKSYGRVFLTSLPRCPVEVIMNDGSIVEAEMWEDE